MYRSSFGYSQVREGIRVQVYRKLREPKNGEEGNNDENGERGNENENSGGDEVSFDNLRSYFPKAVVHSLVQQPIPTSIVFPPPRSKTKQMMNSYQKENNMNKRRGGKRRAAPGRGSNRGRGHSGGRCRERGRSAGRGRGHSAGGRGEAGEDNNTNVETEEVSFDEMDDLREYIEEEEVASVHETEAIPGIRDNSITPTIPVILQISDWVIRILDGQNEIGKESLRKKMIENHIKNMADHKSSPLWIARQLKVCDAMETCLARKALRDADKEGSVEPILADVLKASTRRRKEIQEQMEGKFCDKQLALNVLTEKDW